MKIGIFGTGNIGGTLARKLASSGHDVRITKSDGAKKLQGFAAEIGATAVDACGAVEGADLIILSIPFPAIATLPKGLFDYIPATVPVIDTGNYYPGMRDPIIAEIENGMAESVWVSQQLGRPIIKAFNNILAATLADLGRPSGSPDRIAAAVAGDDAVQKGMVMRIVDEMGLEPVDAGSLEESWRQQPSTPAYCCDWNANEMKEALAAAVMGEAAAKRDRMMEQYSALGPDITRDQMVASNRKVNAGK